MRFEESEVYISGKFYKELGEMLMNPLTNIKDLVSFELKHGVKLNIQFLSKEKENNGPAEQE
jgi:hypothetical protein